MRDCLPRKLAAVLYADVAGYSRLTGEDDSGLAAALARRAIEADRDDAHVMAAAGFVLVMVMRDY